MADSLVVVAAALTSSAASHSCRKTWFHRQLACYTLGTDTTAASRSTSCLLQSRVCCFPKYTPTKAEIEYPIASPDRQLEGERGPTVAFGACPFPPVEFGTRGGSGASLRRPWEFLNSGLEACFCPKAGLGDGHLRPTARAGKCQTFPAGKKPFGSKWVIGQKRRLVSGWRLSFFREGI